MSSPFGRRRSDFDPAVLRSIDARWAQTVRERNALLAALKACEAVMCESAGSAFGVHRQLTNVELGRLWIAVTEQAKAAIAICEGSK